MESLEPLTLKQSMKADDTSTVGYSLKHFDRDLIGITVCIPWLSRGVPGRGISMGGVLRAFSVKKCNSTLKYERAYAVKIRFLDLIYQS